MEERVKTQKVKEDKKQGLAEEAKRKLSGKVVVVKANAGDGGKLFGSVTTAQVADAVLAQYGVTVDKKDIKLDDQIKQTGDYQFRIKLYPGIDAQMTLKVESD